MPVDGSQPSRSENTSTSIIPTQKSGMETPANATSMEALSCHLPAWVAALMPSGMPTRAVIRMLTTLMMAVRGILVISSPATEAFVI